jgi:hypothetical protein
MKTILTSVLLMLAAGIYGQQIKFYRTFPKPDWDYADAVIERYDGNYLMAGSSTSQNGTDSDISLILVDPLGNTIWDKYLGQADSSEFAYSLVETSDSNYLVSGRIGMYFPYLSLFDINGDLIRDMRYPEGDQCYGAYSVGETADGNYYFIETGPVSTLYLVNPSGDIIWSRAYDFAYCHAVIQTSDLGFILVGYKEEQFGYYGNIMIRTDPEGDTLWTKTIPLPGYYDNNSVLQLEDNGFIIAGLFDDPEIFDEDPMTMLIRADSEGDTLWTRNHWVGTPICIRECRFHSGYILSSRLWISPGGIYPDIYYLYITRLDNEGNMIWSRRFDGYTYNISNNVTQTSDGGFLLTGYKQVNTMPADAILIKLDSLGDYVLSTKEIEFDESPQVMTYPVPAKDILHFRMTENNLKIDEVSIFNSSGQKLDVVPVFSGNELMLDLAGFPPGIYFYKLTARNKKTFNGKFLVAN